LKEVHKSNDAITTYATVDVEVHDYLSASSRSEDTDPLAFWKVKELTYPTLAKMADLYLSMLATSAPCGKII